MRGRRDVGHRHQGRGEGQRGHDPQDTVPDRSHFSSSSSCIQTPGESARQARRFNHIQVSIWPAAPLLVEHVSVDTDDARLLKQNGAPPLELNRAASHDESMTWDDVELAVDARSTLAEGPAWDERDGTLLWVDIAGFSVHRYD